MKVVLYSRVSTDEQAQKGFSLDYQYERLNQYCQLQKYQVVKNFREDFSAKNFNRPAWKELELFVEANRSEVDMVLVLKWDRFSRNQEEALRVIREFRDLGIQINAVEQPLDLNVPDNKAILAFYLVLPEIDNDKRSSSIREGNHTALKNGYFINKAPYGYVNIRRHRQEKTTLEIVPEKALFINEAFNRVAAGIESAESVLISLRKKGFKMSKSNFLRTLRKVVYTGQVLVPAFKKEPEMIVNGQHDAIIDYDTFLKVQAVLDSKRWKGIVPSHKNELFPLRNYLTCDCCNGNMTASSSKGRNGKHHYYHCRNGLRIQRDSVHKMFYNLIENLTINQNIIDVYRKILSDASEQQKKSNHKNIVRIEREIRQLEIQIHSIEDRLANNDIGLDTFNRINQRQQSNLMELKSELHRLNTAEQPTTDYISNGLEFLSNLKNIYIKTDYEGKRLIIGSIFPEKLRISKDKCRTTELNKVVELLCRNGGDFEGIKKGTNTELSDLSPSVHLTTLLSNHFIEDLKKLNDLAKVLSIN